MKNILHNVIMSILIIMVIGLVILGGMAFYGVMNPPADTVYVTTGRTLVNDIDNRTAYWYIDATMDAVVTADTDHKVVCDRFYDQYHHRDLQNAIFDEIYNNVELQNQAATFSVINAYNKLYCSGK